MSVHRGYVAVSFGQMHYRYAGTPGKPVLVLLHQTPSTSEMYVDLMQRLAGEFRLIAPDTPGMGMSDPIAGEVSIPTLANGIAEFLDELGITQCALFGHHTGAAIAAELAARHAGLATAVAMSGPTLLNDEVRELLPRVSFAFPVTDDGNHMTGMWERIAAKDPQAPRSIVLREALTGLQIGPGYPAAYNAVLEHDFEAAARNIACPALVFAGTSDPLYDALDGTLALLRNGRKATIEGARTFVCETHCDEVAGLLREFVPTEVAA